MSGVPDKLIAGIGVTFLQVLKLILHLLNGFVTSSNNSGPRCAVPLDLYLVISYEVFFSFSTGFVFAFLGLIPGIDDFIQYQLSQKWFFRIVTWIVFILFTQAQLPLVMTIASQQECNTSTAVKVYYWIISVLAEIFAICLAVFLCTALSQRHAHRDIKVELFRKKITSQQVFAADNLFDQQGIQMFKNIYSDFRDDVLHFDEFIIQYIKAFNSFKFTLQRRNLCRRSTAGCLYCGILLKHTEQNEIIFVCDSAKHILHWDCYVKASVQSINFCPECLRLQAEISIQPSRDQNLLAKFYTNEATSIPVRIEDTANAILED